MIQKTIEAAEPFALSLIIFAGAYMVGWVRFSNPKFVGGAVIVAGIVLLIQHSLLRIKKPVV